jgi:hypothetical protein
MCESDTLQSASAKFVSRLEEAGSDIVAYTALGVGHAWDKVVRPNLHGAKERDEVYALFVRRLKEAYGAT